MWEKAETEMKEGISARFRKDFTYSQWGVRYWQICMGDFEVRKKDFSRMFEVVNRDDANKVSEYIIHPDKKVICINDDADDEEFEDISRMVRDAFDSVLKDKSKFEL